MTQLIQRSVAALKEGRMNVGQTERWISVVAGGAMVGMGVRRGSIGGMVMAVVGGGLLYRGLSGRCPAYSALGVDTTRSGGARPEDYFERSIHVERSVTVHRPAEELYAFWRNMENLPQFMRHLRSVRHLDLQRSHWTAKAPANTSVEWDATIINDEPNQLIAWRSLEEADVDNAGSVRFVPTADGKGTEVRVVLDYIPPAGRLGAAVASLFGEEPGLQIADDLWRFKRLMEAGEEALLTEGQSQGE